MAQEQALSTPVPVALDLAIVPPHEVLTLSPESAERFQKTVPTDTVRKVAIRLWVIGTGVCAIRVTPNDILLRHPHPASAQGDHVLPKSRGGGDHWGNLRATHRQCNMERYDAFSELEPSRAQQLLAAAIHRHKHPTDFLPQQIEQERKILAMLDGFVAETRSDLAARLLDRRPSTPAIDFLRRGLALREKNYAAQQRKVNRLSANLNANLSVPLTG